MNEYESIKFLLMSVIEATYNDRKPFIISSEEIEKKFLQPLKLFLF